MAQLPPLNALRAFDAAGRHLNFRAAADEIGVTQGAIAQQVRLLEAHLGLPLFERLPKGLAFTSSGRSYHIRVMTVFEDLRNATAILRPESSKVLVSVTPTFAAKWLIPNLPEFSAANPEIEMRILATEQMLSFQGDGLDLAVRQAQPPFGAAIDAIHLFRQDIIAVSSPQLIERYRLPLDRAVLSHMPKLHDAHDLWPQFLKAIKVEDRSERGLRLSQTALAIDAALSGQGIALVSKFLVARDLNLGNLVQVMPERLAGDRDFYLLAKMKSKRSPATELVLQWISSKAAPDV
jgi:LysR family glycine cleavage system transcriptional activator